MADLSFAEYFEGSNAESGKDIIANSIIEKLDGQSYPFGSFVRNKIAGDDFREMEVFFGGDGCGAQKLFIDKMRAAGYTAVKLKTESPPEYPTGVKLAKSKWRIDDENGDAVRVICWSAPDAAEDDDHPFQFEDFDVNQLYVDPHDKNTIYSHSLVGERTERETLQILDKAENKTYTPNRQAPAQKLEKLMEKGYEEFVPIKKEFKKVQGPTAIKPPMQNQSKPQEKKMDKLNNKGGFVDMMKADSKSAAYRVTATQMTKGVKAGILLLMKDKGMPGEKLEIVREVLESEIGSALISMALGYGMTYIPVFQADARAAQLAGEFRITGMATVGNEVIGNAVQYLLPAVMGAMEMLPPADKIRISEGSHEEEETEEEQEHEEEEEEKVKPKAAQM